MALAHAYKKLIVDEIYNIPEEFLPSVLQILQFIRKISAKKKKKESPTDRLLKLADTMENPDKLNARDYKKKVVLEHLQTG